MSSAPFLTPHNNHPLAPQVPLPDESAVSSSGSRSSPYACPPPVVRYLVMEKQQSDSSRSGTPRPGYVPPFVGPLEVATEVPLQVLVIVMALCCFGTSRDCLFFALLALVVFHQFCFRLRLLLWKTWMTWTTSTTWTSLCPLASLGLKTPWSPQPLAPLATGSHPSLLRLVLTQTVVPVVLGLGRT